MHDITLIIALLLGCGFLAAKLGQRLRLPSVTGYIIAGLLLGPSGFGLFQKEAVGDRLDHFIQIALMLIAFGIAEHLDFKRLKNFLKSIGGIGLAETSGAFLLVGTGTFIISKGIGVGPADWQNIDFIILAILLGAVSVATAPAATLHVMRELKAAGPLTTTLMAVVAIDNGLAIMMFGMTVSTARHLAGTGGGTLIAPLAASLAEIAFSLLIGFISGLLIDLVTNRLSRQSEMLTVGLALLLLGGELARMFDLSPLLAGMAAGFTIVNRAHRDVRLFRALNAFEAPVYVLFFTLAGAHLDISSLKLAGWVGLIYFLLRILGKVSGSYLGARATASPAAVRHYLGLALMPQAGVAIGLVFLIKGDADLTVYSSIITPVVLAGVFLSELAGPVSARYAVIRAGEVPGGEREKNFPKLLKNGNGLPHFTYECDLVPWTWEKLNPAANPSGAVIFGSAHRKNALGLTRMATLIAHHLGSLPMAVRVRTDSGSPARLQDGIEEEVAFEAEIGEAWGIGYPLETVAIRAENVSQGLIAVAEQHRARAIILGHPLVSTAQEFQKIVGAVTAKARCPVVVVRFCGLLHTERILVPVVSSADLQTVTSTVAALSKVGRHRITLLRLMPPNVSEEELLDTEQKLTVWARSEGLTPFVRCNAMATEARLATIFQEAAQHDLLIMAASDALGLQRIFFGSLAEGVASKCRKPMILVYAPQN